MPKVEATYNYLKGCYIIYAQSQPFQEAKYVVLNKSSDEIDNGDLATIFKLLADELKND